MHRFYLPPAECNRPVLSLNAREAHHALHVLRLQRGDRVAVMDGAGHEFLCEVSDASRHTTSLVVKQKSVIPELPYQITIYQAVPKGKVMDLIVQKATELGVSRIVPVLSERVVPHLESGQSEAKVEKWISTAIEAIKQSGSAWLPKIEQPIRIHDCLALHEKYDLPLVASLRNDTRHPREIFKHYRNERKRAPQSVCVWVGPEGDFTPAEMSEIRGWGGLPITLGPRILRVETAAIYCLSILNYELQSPDLS